MRIKGVVKTSVHRVRAHSSTCIKPSGIPKSLAIRQWAIEGILSVEVLLLTIEVLNEFLVVLMKLVDLSRILNLRLLGVSDGPAAAW